MNPSTIVPLCLIVVFPLFAGCGLISPPKLTPELETRLPSFSMSVEARTRAALADILVDPESARIRRVTEPVPGFRNSAVWWPSVKTVGWYWTAEVNSKNRLGGYVGYTPFEFLLDERREVHWRRYRYPVGGLFGLFGAGTPTLAAFEPTDHKPKVAAQGAP